MIQSHSNDITPELDEALKGEIEAAFHETWRKSQNTAGMSYVLWKCILKFLVNGVYHVLCVVNTLQRILDIKRPLLMWCFSPVQPLAKAE